MFLARIGSIEGFEQMVSSRGVNPIALMSEVDLAPSQFRDPNTYVSYSKIAELLEIAAQQCGEPLFGLLLADRQSSSVLGDLSMTLAQQPTLGDALESVNKYLYLHARGAHLRQIAKGRDVRLELRIEISSPRGLFQIMQMSIGQLANFVSELLAQPDIRIPVMLEQTSPPPEAHTPGRQVFARLVFDAPINGVQFPQGWLSRRPSYDKDTVRRHFQEQLLQLQQRYPDNLQDQIRDIIGKTLPTGECSIRRVASTLGLHPRVLQKRLKQQGNSYNQLLRETRTEIAKQHLRHHSMSVTDLALNLGYSEVSVFSRNFRQWTGMSPRNWQSSRS